MERTGGTKAGGKRNKALAATTGDEVTRTIVGSDSMAVLMSSYTASVCRALGSWSGLWGVGFPETHLISSSEARKRQRKPKSLVFGSTRNWQKQGSKGMSGNRKKTRQWKVTRTVKAMLVW